MRDFEMEFISKRNELILKYGENEIKIPANKSAALLLFTEAFKKLPDNISFEDEISELQGHVLELPNIRDQISILQQKFLFNRFCEIVIENKKSKFINEENDIEKKIINVQGIGLTAAVMKESKINTGHIRSELILDLYDLYIFQYGLYIQNPSHPIFLNAVIENKIDRNSKEILIQENHNSGKSGCLNFVLILILFVIILILEIE